MISPIMLIIVGLLTLLFGRRIFWLFVGAAGFLFGLSVAQAGLHIQSQAIQLLAALCVGLIFAGLALAIQRPMATVAGFIALGFVGLGLALQLGLTPLMQIALFLAFGLIGALLVAALFDWALIVISALNGAVAIGSGLSALYPIAPLIASVTVIVLAIVGIAYQARSLGAPVGGLTA